MSLSKYIKTCK